MYRKFTVYMKNRKILIFDFDGTLYSGENKFSQIPAFIKANKRKMLPNISDEQYSQIVKENPTWTDAWYGNDLAKHIYLFKDKYPEFNISIKDYLAWENSNIEPVIIDKNEVVDATFLKKLCSEYHVYIVSNSLTNHIKHYMKILNINYNWFAGVLSNRFCYKDMTKKLYYQRILKKEACNPKDVYVFGDSYKSDLVPAEELGMNAYQINNANDLPTIVNNALKQKNN